MDENPAKTLATAQSPEERKAAAKRLADARWANTTQEERTRAAKHAARAPRPSRRKTPTAPDPKQFIGEVVVLPGGKRALTPVALVHLLQILPDAEMEQLTAFAGKEPDEFVFKTTEWLIKRFGCTLGRKRKKPRS